MTRRKTAVVALPWLSPTYAQQTLGSMCESLRSCVVERDNRDGTPVAYVWNLAREYVVDGQADWLIVCSTAARFGLKAGTDLLHELSRRDGGMVSVVGAAWHLHAIHRDVLREVGRFDAFDKAYCEDADYIYRHQLAGLGNLWRGEGNVHVDVDAFFRDDAHSIRAGHADPETPKRALINYAAKWGGPPKREVFTHPYNDEERDWRWLRSDHESGSSRDATQAGLGTSAPNSPDTSNPMLH